MRLGGTNLQMKTTFLCISLTLKKHSKTMYASFETFRISVCVHTMQSVCVHTMDFVSAHKQIN